MDKIKNAVYYILEKEFALDEVVDEDRLKEDYGFISEDYIELQELIEDEFDIKISTIELAKINNVKQLYNLITEKLK